MNSQNCTTYGAGMERVRYFSRQLITADDMLAEQQYFRQKLRRHNRFLHGWGVVCGLEVLASATSTYPWQVIVGVGYALGPYGDEIYVAEPRCFNILNCISSVMNPCDPTAPPTPVLPAEIYLAIRYSECETRPVRVHPLGCACEDTLCEYSRIRDDFELSCVPEMAEPPIATCEICDRFLVATCPPCPDSPWVVLARITLPKPSAAQSDVTKIQLADTDIDNFVRRQILSTAKLQEQLIACICPQPTPVLSADMGVTKDGKPSGLTGLNWTVTVTNHGPDHAENVVVTDTLPSESDFKLLTSPGWTAGAGNQLTAALGKMGVGESKTLTVTAEGTQGGDPAPYINTVAVTSSTPDHNNGNNVAHNTLTVPPISIQ
jgi:hypothetical protein